MFVSVLDRQCEMFDMHINDTLALPFASLHRILLSVSQTV
jgi:hypothetical protein